MEIQNERALTIERESTVQHLLRLNSDITKEKRIAIEAMKAAASAMLAQGQALRQTELELGDDFQGFLNGLESRGLDAGLARHNLALSKKYKSAADLFDDSAGNRQLVLKNFAPPKPEPTEAKAKDNPAAPFSIIYRLTTDPLDWSQRVVDEFLSKARPVVDLARELSNR